MLVRGRLVVKLPATRCAELRDAGVAESLAVGQRVMKEWIEVTADDRQTWRDLAAEAYAFVGGGRGRAPEPLRYASAIPRRSA